MEAALLLIQVIDAAVKAGINFDVVMTKLSGLVKQRHAEGVTLTKEDVLALFDQGDADAAAQYKKIEAALADPNTRSWSSLKSMV